MNVRILDPAVFEFSEAVDYYNLQESELGIKFSACVQQAIERIESRPTWNVKVNEEIFRVHVKRFPYKIYYFVDAQEIVIIAILHNHRKPGLWKDRR